MAIFGMYDGFLGCIWVYKPSLVAVGGVPFSLHLNLQVGTSCTFAELRAELETIWKRGEVAGWMGLVGSKKYFKVK